MFRPAVTAKLHQASIQGITSPSQGESTVGAKCDFSARTAQHDLRTLISDLARRHLHCYFVYSDLVGICEVLPDSKEITVYSKI